MQRGLVGSEMCIRDRYMGYGQVSGNLGDLEKFLSGEEVIIWQEYEDNILKNPEHTSMYNELVKTKGKDNVERRKAVSYTHLTLPTILLVQISVVAVSLKKKQQKKKQT
eukprot:TRINITY_DN25883_c0_g1_i1.p1 TRINITY_DN25883_c0_g1~~TRINITY_DN25883_c0_g1_i1.p1  ORF type:complete len:109 (+),score=35.43 TRINITY_DN25883_c0_g1_i1:96-422(+)